MSGRFLTVGTEKLCVCGVTYGTFRRCAGHQFPAPAAVVADFARMAASGVTAVRTYTVPPPWLLDVAAERGLFVMVGVPWEQHVAFLDDRERMRAIERRVRAGVAACARHPAVLGYAVGNEIPSAIVRWHGRRGVERYIERLYVAAKEEDPEALVTYVNYPPTEYLQLPFLDLMCCNVYLERTCDFGSYLGRLHSLAGDRPLVLGELGLDSRRHGEEEQARVLDEQLRTAFASGCAGAFVFAWTDDWYILTATDPTDADGVAMEDWDFGITRRDRSPKLALAVVRSAFADVPVAPDPASPRVSVVVCTRNGARTLRDCLAGLAKLEHPSFEVIVVNDGSTDGTARIVEDSGFQLITTDQLGLASARNTGMSAATGEIIAYIDDDAWPDPHWLTHLVGMFQSTGHAAIGGPNLAPPQDGLIAECVASAPGSPTHVLVSDYEAEHIPGCNMAFRRSCLQEIDGFDPQFRTAGDDVDVCWRLRGRGLTIGFHPGAVVWHHRRGSIGAYFKQQRGYGAAEAQLERKWPEKFNAWGHLGWRGHVYGRGALVTVGRRRVDYGTWGGRLFQSLYEPSSGLLTALPLIPEWYLLLALLLGAGAAGALWTPLHAALSLPALAAAASVAQAAASASGASFPSAVRSRRGRAAMTALTTLLYLMQPAARLTGRLSRGLSPWRRRRIGGLALPHRRTLCFWSESWQAPSDRLRGIELALRSSGTAFRRGGHLDRWDIEVRGGILGSVRTLMAVEEHGAGRQLVRLRAWPRWSWLPPALAALLSCVAVTATVARRWPVVGCASAGIVFIGLGWVQDCATAFATVSRSFHSPNDARASQPLQRGH